MAGATALTGTVPDSAPHSPLKTSGLSLVARMRFIAASGVPTMATPRTKFVGPAIDVDAVDDQRDDLKGLRRAALGDGEAGRDVFEVEAVGLALLLRFFDQLLAQFGVGNRFGRGDDEVALAAGGHAAGLRAAVAVGFGEAGDGQARHEEGFEDAVLNELDALGFLAFVVVGVAAAEPGSAEGGAGGVVGDGEEAGQYVFAELLGKGLAFVVAALALAFETVAEHLMKEDGGGAAGEDGGAIEGLGDGRFAQRFEACAEGADGGFEVGLGGKAVDGFGFEGLIAKEVHAIVGAGDGEDDEARLQVRRDDARALGGGEVVGLILHGEQDEVAIDVGVVAEDARNGADALFPCGAVDGDGRRRLGDGDLWWLGGEVGRGVFFFGADLGFGLDAQVVVDGVAVAAVGGDPERTGEGLAVVDDGQLDGVDCGAAMVAVGVVELGRTDADLDVGNAHVI